MSAALCACGAKAANGDAFSRPAPEKLCACAKERGVLRVSVPPLLLNACGLDLMFDSLIGFEIARGELCSNEDGDSSVDALLANMLGAGAKNVNPCCSSLNTAPCWAASAPPAAIAAAPCAAGNAS
eukprot:1138161-Pelagomonas_calceolata.AAC.5